MIEYGWGDYDETYIVMSFKAQWKVSDYTQCIVALYSKMAKVDHNINFVVDLRYSAVPPMSILPTITRSLKRRPDNVGRVIVISRTTIWKRIFNTIANEDRDRELEIYFVTTIDEAYALIPVAGAS